MRIPGTKVYRAFHELDRFSDEQCRRFMRSALRPWWLQALRLLLCFAASLFVFFGVLVPLVGQIDLRRRLDYLSYLIVIPPPTMCVFAGLLFRDYLLRRRLRRVLRNRGACRGCQYPLLGLSLSDANTVSCPECGLVSEVDSAIGELAMGTGEARPRDKRVLDGDATVIEPPYWTVRRRKYLRRGIWGTAGFIVLLVVLAGSAIGYRLTVVAADAAKAAVLFDPVRLVGKAVGGQQVAGPSTMDILQGLKDELDAFGLQFESFESVVQLPDGSLVSPVIDFSTFGFGLATDNSYWREGSREDVQFRGNQALTAKVLRQLAGTDLLRRIDAINGLTGFGFRLLPSFRPPASWYDSRLGTVLKLFYLNQSRFTVAMRSGDAAEAIIALRSGLSIARCCRANAAPLGFWLEVTMLATVLPTLSGADDPTLRAFAEAIGPDDSPQVLLDSIEYSRFLEQQRLSEVFSQTEFTRWGVVSAASWFLSPLDFKTWYDSRRLGRFEENLAENDEIAGLVRVVALLRPVDRIAKLQVRSRLVSGGRFFLGESAILTPECERSIGSFDRLLVLRSGVRTRIAIERYQRTAGLYPLTLDELVPDFLAALPTDPWSGKSLSYRWLFKRSSPSGAYLLYSIGPDCVDDGGSPRVEITTNAPMSYGLPVGTPGDLVFSDGP